MHGADDSSPTQHYHGLHQGHGARQRPAGGVRAAQPAAARQEQHLLRHGQGRRPRQLIAHGTWIYLARMRQLKKKVCFENHSTFTLTHLLHLIFFFIFVWLLHIAHERSSYRNSFVRYFGQRWVYTEEKTKV